MIALLEKEKDSTVEVDKWNCGGRLESKHSNSRTIINMPLKKK
jgi:hypothetical protein